MGPWVWVVVMMLLGTLATAQPAEKPWAKNVPDDAQSRALAIYREGNAEFAESRYPQALVKYREALHHWDHPGIRFNMAVSLINLDQPLEAFEHLEASLKYGAAAIGDDAYAQGLTYKKLLLGQLAKLRVSCREPGAEVTLDGKLLLKGPGEISRLIVPGEHQLVARKQGFVTETSKLVLLPNKDLVHEVKLRTLDMNSKLVRRWKARTPWIVVATGGGVAALGGLGLYLARQDFNTYDQLVGEHCRPSGCPPGTPVPKSITSHDSRGKIENVLGVGLLAIGGAIATAGLVGVYLNVPRRVAERAPTVTPSIGPHGAGASLGWEF